jgi:hypothetical protein
VDTIATPFDEEFGLVADLIRKHARRDPGHAAVIDPPGARSATALWTP